MNDARNAFISACRAVWTVRRRRAIGVRRALPRTVRAPCTRAPRTIMRGVGGATCAEMTLQVW